MILTSQFENYIRTEWFFQFLKVHFVIRAPKLVCMYTKIQVIWSSRVEYESDSNFTDVAELTDDDDGSGSRSLSQINELNNPKTTNYRSSFISTFKNC